MDVSGADRAVRYERSGRTGSGRKLAAKQVSRVTGLPAPGSFGPKFPRHPGHLRPPKGMSGPPFTNGTVEDAHDGRFTVVSQNPYWESSDPRSSPRPRLTPSPPPPPT